jgi:hypothetical protein
MEKVFRSQRKAVTLLSGQMLEAADDLASLLMVLISYVFFYMS